MTATALEQAGLTSAGDDAALCITALGPELTAYVAGAKTVAQLESWLAAVQGPAPQVRRRLSAAAELVTTFEVANRSALVAAWLREQDPAGFVPARALRFSDGDKTSVQGLLDAGEMWALTAAA